MALTVQSAYHKDQRTAKSAQLQHRHFAFIASVIKNNMGTLHTAEKSIVVDAFANALGRTNPRFDRTRFILATGILDPTQSANMPGNYTSADFKVGD